MKLYKTTNGIIVESNEGFFQTNIQNWDKFINDDSLLKKIYKLVTMALQNDDYENLF